MPLINGSKSIAGWEGWRVNWFLFGILVLLCSLLCLWGIRNSPADMGLKPVGDDSFASSPGQQRAGVEVPLSLILHCSVIYFLFGFTSAIYLTFVVTAIVREWGYSESVAGLFWSWIGLMSLLSGPVPGLVSDRLGRKKTLMMIFFIQAASYLFVVVSHAPPFLFLSITCYGIVAWAIPSVMAALVGDYVGAKRMATVFGFVTCIFGFGQIAGPAVGGILTQTYGSFSFSFQLALVLAILAMILSALLPGQGRMTCSGARFED